MRRKVAASKRLISRGTWYNCNLIGLCSLLDLGNKFVLSHVGALFVGNLALIYPGHVPPNKGECLEMIYSSNQVETVVRMQGLCDACSLIIPRPIACTSWLAGEPPTKSHKNKITFPNL